MIRKIGVPLHPVVASFSRNWAGHGQLPNCCGRKWPARRIELDRDFNSLFKVKFFNYPDFTIHEADALKFDFAELRKSDEKLRVVGNLPYNISTPLIFHLLSFQGLIHDMHFMLQKEVVERLAAKPGTGECGRLSVMAQYYCEIENLFLVPPECFKPQPKVESALYAWPPNSSPQHLALDRRVGWYAALSFAQRRKTLRKIIWKLCY